MTRKKICLVVGSITAALLIAFSGFVLRDFSHRVPIVIGPKKILAFASLLTVLAAAVTFYFFPLTRKRIAGTFCLVLGIFLCIPVFPFPADSLRLPLGLTLFFCGLMLWTEHVTVIQISEKTQFWIALALSAAVLSPMLFTGYCWDDAFFSSVIPAMRISGASIFARIWGEILQYGRMGRLNPFATFQFLLFYFLPNAVSYKVYILLVTLLGEGLFYLFIKKLTGSHRAALTTLLLLPVCFQLRLYHDPFTGYYGLMQVMFCELMGSLILFLDGLEGRKRAMAGSLLLFIISLMSYEMAYPFLAFYLLLSVFRKKSLKSALPFILSSMVLFGASMVLRMTYVSEDTVYNGTQFSLDLPAILRTWFYQISGAFPLSYHLSGNDAPLLGRLIFHREVFTDSRTTFISRFRLIDLVLLGLFLLLMAINQEEYTVSAARKWERLLFGALLTVLPGMVISLSVKYQEDLRAGIAYIPVYFSCFGTAFLLREVFAFPGKHFPKAVFTGYFATALLLTQQSNRQVMEELNKTFLYPREVGEAATQAGIIQNPYSENSLLLSNNRYYLWEAGWLDEPYQSDFYSLNARRPISAIGLNDYLETYIPKNSKLDFPEDMLLIEYDGGAEDGMAKLGRLRQTEINRENSCLKRALVSDVFIFIKGFSGKNPVIQYIDAKSNARTVKPDENWLVRQTDAGTLYRVMDNEFIIFDSIGVTEYQ